MDCEFNCCNCHQNLLTTRIKDQFICIVHNVLQMDILAKANLLNSVKPAEAFVIAAHDQ